VQVKQRREGVMGLACVSRGKGGVVIRLGTAWRYLRAGGVTEWSSAPFSVQASQLLLLSSKAPGNASPVSGDSASVALDCDAGVPLAGQDRLRVQRVVEMRESQSG
jgi:hypothetical protein